MRLDKALALIDWYQGKVDGHSARLLAEATAARQAESPAKVDPFCPEHGAKPTAYEECSCAGRDAVNLACAWADYRKDYGVHPSDMTAAHKAFKAGWQAAREGDRSGVLR